MHLLQRGVEGVITIDVTPFNGFPHPWVLVDLPGSQFPQPITPLKRQRLARHGRGCCSVPTPTNRTENWRFHESCDRALAGFRHAAAGNCRNRALLF
jgi:hypothetical protein